jgi:hypothetical protein
MAQKQTKVCDSSVTIGPARAMPRASAPDVRKAKSMPLVVRMEQRLKLLIRLDIRND